MGELSIQDYEEQLKILNLLTPENFKWFLTEKVKYCVTELNVVFGVRRWSIMVHEDDPTLNKFIFETYDSYEYVIALLDNRISVRCISHTDVADYDVNLIADIVATYVMSSDKEAAAIIDKITELKSFLEV